MKTAICFSGLVGSTKGKSQELIGDFKTCFQISSALYREHILDKNDVDVFVHSWSTGTKDEILEAYKPKKHIIEKQIVFDTPDYKILRETPEIRKQTHYSLWYSRKMAAQLKSEYEKEHVTPYITGANPSVECGKFSIHQVMFEADFSHIRWTLDTSEDLQRIRKLVAKLPETYSWLNALAVATLNSELLGLQ